MAARSDSRRTRTAGSHQRCWIWGRHLVRETLAAGRWPVQDVFLSEALADDVRLQLQQLCELRHRPPRVVSASRIAQLCGSRDHQGCAARMRPFPYDPVDQLVCTGPPWVALDGVVDSYNFGSILRSAEVLGAAGVLVGTRRQSGVNGLVARASVGALNRIRLVEHASLEAGLRLLQLTGGRLFGLAGRTGRAVWDCDLRENAVLVIGNEATGLSASVRDLCEQLVEIPQAGQIDSLNAAVAAGVALAEAARQRVQLAG